MPRWGWVAMLRRSLQEHAVPTGPVVGRDRVRVPLQLCLVRWQLLRARAGLLRRQLRRYQQR